jgi:hypothetical protein
MKKDNFYASIKHLPYLGLLNFEGDLFRAYDMLDGTFTIVNEHHENVTNTDAAGILEYMEGNGKPIVNYNGKTWIIPQEHPNARPTKKHLYDFLKLTKDSKELAKHELLKLYENQIMDLTTMSKIELGEDVIMEIKRLKSIING